MNKVDTFLYKGKYFNYGEKSIIKFNYINKEQQLLIYEYFTQKLMPLFGSNSNRASLGKEYIMPYFVDKKGAFTIKNTKIIGGSSIPDDILNEILEEMINKGLINIIKNEKEKSYV